MKVTIEKLVHGGYGLARTDNGVVFVSGVLPGETVEAKPQGTLNGASHASVEAILEPSLSRREPPCPFATVCGGCDWLHIRSDAQLTIKESIFRECLTRTGRITGIPPVELYASPETGYRIRVRFKIDSSGAIGFVRRRSNAVVPVTECLLLHRPLNELLDSLNQSNTRIKETELMAIAGESGTASNPVIPGHTVLSTEIRAGNCRFKVTGRSFFQGNRFLLERLGTWAATNTHGSKCLDVYGGSGFFSVMMASKFEQVLLVESEAGQVDEARDNFLLNGCTNCKAEAKTAERLFREHADGRDLPPDFLIVDPPRPGLARTVREGIARLHPSTILYVSCNPSTQARDLDFLVNKTGYTLQRAALFDLYPNTHHLETAVILQRD
jgi:23S rRNA (uracil1939-C5)-methyltransferase